MKMSKKFSVVKMLEDFSISQKSLILDECSFSYKPLNLSGGPEENRGNFSQDSQPPCQESNP
jgi:hypothetical protein